MLFFVLSSALAQDVTSGGDMPTLNAQVFTPSIDSARFIRLTDSDLGAPGASWRATAGYHRAPLNYVDSQLQTSLLLHDVVAADLAAAWAFDHARVGVGVPIMLHSTDGDTIDQSGIGDLVVDAKWRWLDGEDGFGSALSGRLIAPTSTMQLGLANEGWGLDAELALDRDVGSVRWLGTLGYAHRPTHAMQNVTWGPQLRLGLGASVALSDKSALMGELSAGQVVNDLSNPAGRPLELLVGGQHLFSDKTLVRPAVAVGLNGSVGTPQVRALVSVARVRAADGDRDGDGFADSLDACPDEPEDFDRYQDEDGCPEDTLVTIRIVDGDGEPGTRPWESGDEEGWSGDTAELPEGPREFIVDGQPQVAEIPDGEPTEVVLDVPAPRGALTVRAVDPDGQPVPDAQWTGRGPTNAAAAPTGEARELRGGEWWVRVSAPGHHPGVGDATVVEDEAATVTVVLVPNPADRDGDGLVDRKDACPDAPEDFDAYQDDDGCPEDTVVRVDVVDSDGFPTAERPWRTGRVAGMPGDTAELPAGPHTFEVLPDLVQARIPDGPPTRVELVVAAPRGTLSVDVVDATGAPIDGAEWSAEGPASLDDMEPGESASVRPGDYTLRAHAPGYRRGEAQVVVVHEAHESLRLELLPAKAQLVADRIDLKDSVYFETDSDVIDAESHALLDEVAEIIMDHPELAMIRIEGHTDRRGSNTYNLDLSQRRADSVRRYLMSEGVSEERLESIGFGEEFPLAQANNPMAWSLNRRVDFFVAARSDASVSSD